MEQIAFNIVLIIILLIAFVLSRQGVKKAAHKVKLTVRQVYYRTVYLRSNHWREVRERKLCQVGGMCEKCGEEARFQIPLDVHHLTYKRLGREKLSDLQVLCRACHEGEERRKKGARLR